MLVAAELLSGNKTMDASEQPDTVLHKTKEHSAANIAPNLISTEAQYMSHCAQMPAQGLQTSLWRDWRDEGIIVKSKISWQSRGSYLITSASKLGLWKQC